MTSENSMHEAGHPNLVLWDIPEGGSGEGGGRGVQEGKHPWLVQCRCVAKTAMIL